MELKKPEPDEPDEPEYVHGYCMNCENIRPRLRWGEPGTGYCVYLGCHMPLNDSCLRWRN